MTRFILKFKGKDITLIQRPPAKGEDSDEIGETDDVEEAFAFIAKTIKDQEIEHYEVIAFDKGKKEVLDFDYKEVLKNTRNRNFNFEDEDDSERKRPDFGNEDDDPRFNRRQPRRRGFVYTPSASIDDYKNLGFAFKDALTPEKYE